MEPRLCKFLQVALANQQSLRCYFETFLLSFESTACAFIFRQLKEPNLA